jgi:hypothetical protein
LSISASRYESKRSAFVVPAHLQSSPEFLGRYVQVTVRLLDARVPQHQLDDADVDAVGEQPAGAFLPQVVPAEIDPLELLSGPCGAFAARLRLVAVREQLQGLPVSTIAEPDVRVLPQKEGTDPML